MISLLASVLSSIHDGWIWALFTFGAGAYFFFRGFRALQRKRLIQNTPTSKIRSAAIGLVEVSGLVVGPRAVTSPIAGIPCYYYRTIAWQWQESRLNRGWKKIAEESLHVPFYLDDDTGVVLVNPQGAELDLHRDFRQEFSPSPFSGSVNLPENVASFVARHGIATGKRLKIEEYCIKPKNALFVLGTLAPNPGADLTMPMRPASPASRELGTAPLAMNTTSKPVALPAVAGSAAESGTASQQVIRLSDAARATSAGTMTQQEKVAAALTRAGITNPAAWAAAEEHCPGLTASANARGSVTAAAPALDMKFDLRSQTVLLKGKNDCTFFISWRSQRKVIRSLGWQSISMIWGGPALMLLSLYVLLTHFGLG